VHDVALVRLLKSGMKLYFKITAFYYLECSMVTELVRIFCNSFSTDEQEFPQ